MKPRTVAMTLARTTRTSRRRLRPQGPASVIAGRPPSRHPSPILQKVARERAPRGPRGEDVAAEAEQWRARADAPGLASVGGERCAASQHSCCIRTADLYYSPAVKCSNVVPREGGVVADATHHGWTLTPSSPAFLSDCLCSCCPRRCCITAVTTPRRPICQRCWWRVLTSLKPPIRCYEKLSTEL